MAEASAPPAVATTAVFRLPDLGEGLTEATILGWRVRPGDTVVVDQAVVEVETAKAAVEIPVPFAGTVATLHAEPGQTLAVGAPLVSVATPAAAEDSGSVLVGYGTGGTGGATRRRHRTPRGVDRVRRPVESPTEDPPGRPGSAPVISPLVRKLAHDAGLDLAAIAGTGPSGTIRRADVDAATALGQPGRFAGTDQPTVPGERRIRLDGIRGLAAAKFTRSRREIPEATVWVDVDATELLAARAALNSQVFPAGARSVAPEAGTGGENISVLALVARFAVLALRRHPELNARVEGDELVLLERINLGFAAQTERGLVVPVVPDAQALSTRELSTALAERTTAAREGRLRPRELTGGTFTVNNYGVFGVDGSAAIINHPEVAILGLGRIADKPWVRDGQLAVRKVSQLTLAFDHRACDGGTAGGFLRYVADCVESPLRALGEL